MDELQILRANKLNFSFMFQESSLIFKEIVPWACPTSSTSEECEDSMNCKRTIFMFDMLHRTTIRRLSESQPANHRKVSALDFRNPTTALLHVRSVSKFASRCLGVGWQETVQPCSSATDPLCVFHQAAIPCLVSWVRA